MNQSKPLNQQITRIYLEYEKETLLLDRKEGTLEYAKRDGSRLFFYHLFQDKKAIPELLDFFRSNVVFIESYELTKDTPNRLTITFKNDDKVTHSFEIATFPNGWNEFVKKVNDFIHHQNSGVVLKSNRPK